MFGLPLFAYMPNRLIVCFDRLTGIVRSLLGELVVFLKVFKDTSDELEGTRCVTLHMPVPWLHRLKQHCSVNKDSNDSEALKNMIKARATSFIDMKFKISQLHLLATALNPKMRGLKMLPDSEKQTFYDELCSRVDAISIVDVNPTPTSSSGIYHIYSTTVYI